MIVKSDKNTYMVIVIIAIFSIFTFGMCCLKFGLKIAFIIIGWVVPILVNMCFVLAKTLIMDSEGCTVQILCFSKKYLWENLKIKRIERWNGQGHLPGEVFPVERRGVIFSKHQIGKSEETRPEDYAMFRPFFLSYFFVYFSVGQTLIYKGGPLKEIYCVDEDEFMDRMHEWNIKLDVVTEQKGSYNYADNYLISPDKLKAEQETKVAIKAFVKRENGKLRESIIGQNKCRVYRVLEMLKYNHEIGILLESGEDSIVLRCLHEKDRGGNTIKTFYVEDKRYEKLEDIREILEYHCDEHGFVKIGLVDSSLLDCRVKRMENVF